jgi:hypothetical protein
MPSHSGGGPVAPPKEKLRRCVCRTTSGVIRRAAVVRRAAKEAMVIVECRCRKEWVTSHGFFVRDEIAVGLSGFFVFR